MAFAGRTMLVSALLHAAVVAGLFRLPSALPEAPAEPPAAPGPDIVVPAELLHRPAPRVRATVRRAVRRPGPRGGARSPGPFPPPVPLPDVPPPVVPAFLFPIVTDASLPAEDVLDEAGGSPFGDGSTPGGGGAPAGDGEGGGGDGTAPVLRAVLEVAPPVKRRHVPPDYPELARRARVQGTVVLECTIAPSGQVADVVARRGHPLLTEAAVTAVRQWLYTPTRVGRRPVAVLLTVTVHFRLPR